MIKVPRQDSSMNRFTLTTSTCFLVFSPLSSRYSRHRAARLRGIFREKKRVAYSLWPAIFASSGTPLSSWRSLLAPWFSILKSKIPDLTMRIFTLAVCFSVPSNTRNCNSTSLESRSSPKHPTVDFFPLRQL